MRELMPASRVVWEAGRIESVVREKVWQNCWGTMIGSERDEHRDCRGSAEVRRLSADWQLGTVIAKATGLKDQHEMTEHHGGDNIRS